MRHIRVRMLQSLTLLTLLAPNLSRAEGCRLFLIKALATPAAVRSLGQRGYQVLVTGDIPSRERMSQLLDSAIATDKDFHTGFWVRIAGGGYATEITQTSAADFSDLPTCAQLPNYAAQSYFNIVTGAEARARLDEYYRTRQSVPGLGELILRGEAIHMYGLKNYWSAYQKYKARYANLVGEVRRTWDESNSTDVLKRLDDVRGLLFNYYKNYAEDFAYMALLLEPNGIGNCEANTQLILATLVDAKIDFGPDYRLGAQLFNDHIQPVLLNIKTNELLELTAGTRGTTKGMVYNPELLTFAIARAAGRAMASERDFASFIKLRDMSVSAMQVIPTFKYYVLDQREGAPYSWDFFEYLQFDPSFSKFATGGESNPKFAEMRFNLVSDSARLKPNSPATTSFGLGTDGAKAARAEVLPNMKELISGLLSKGDLPADLLKRMKQLEGTAVHRDREVGQSAVAGVGNGSKSNFYDSLTPEEYDQLQADFWATYEVSARPSAAEQRRQFEVALIKNTDLSLHQTTWKMTTAFHSRPATLDELTSFAKDMSFTFVPLATKSPAERLSLHASQAEIQSPKYELVYRPQYVGVPELSQANDNIAVDGWAGDQFEITKAKRLKALDFGAMAKWTRDRASLANWSDARVAAVRESIANYAALGIVSDAAKQTRPASRIAYYTTQPTEESCALAVNVQRLALQFKADPEGTLNWLGQLDPESRQKVFSFFIGWKSLFPVLDLYTCLKSLPQAQQDWNGLKAPLDEVMNFVVEKALREGQLKVIRPQVITEVSIVPTFEDLPPPPGQRSQRNRTASPEKAPVKATAEADEGTQFKIRTEVLFGLVAAVSPKMVEAPYSQLALAKLWTENAHAYFKANWWAEKAARENFAAAWSWSPFMELRDWMTPALQRLGARIDAVPGAFVSLSDVPLFSHTHVPNYLIEDLKSALSEGNRHFEIARAPAPIQVLRESTDDPAYGNTFSCSSFVTFNRDYNDDLSTRIRATRSLPHDFSSFDWMAAHPCDTGAADFRPIERIAFDVGSAQTQRVSTRNLVIEPGASPGQFRLTMFIRDRTVERALSDAGKPAR